MDLKAVPSDLKSLSDAFHDAAGGYRKLRQNVAPTVVSAGDDGLDHAIRAMADLIISMHDGFTDRLDGHGDKLHNTAHSYQRGDIDVHGLFEDLMKDESRQ